jgi:hypothetical protein
VVAELHPSAWPWSGHSQRDLEGVIAELGLRVTPLGDQVDPLGSYGHVALEPRVPKTHST